MNIKEASVQIKNAMKAYFMKDDNGNYIIPPEKQRPVFLVGAPGIGKTAIMEQIADELDVGLISYSMTHHTRQSALGLPFITKKSFGGKEYQVSEYTMSEIIASVYEFMEQTGKKEGILFLDEINCVSETLTPSMLQFLQYKVFGTHSVPAGWIVVTAGNPTQFNRSAKEFDIATLDRLKKIEVEPDYRVWREYALKKGVHPAIINYLDTREKDFYTIETTPTGKNYVTARGWEDLSAMISLYEAADIDVTENLASQYISNKKISSDFTESYFLYQKYKNFYDPKKILRGDFGDITESAKNSNTDEKMCITGIVLDSVNHECEKTVKKYTAAYTAVSIIKQFSASDDPVAKIDNYISENNSKLAELTDKRNISASRADDEKSVLRILSAAKANALGLSSAVEEIGTEIKTLTETTSESMSNAIKFIKQAFGTEKETLLFISGLTENRYTSKFIRTFGCREYSELSAETDMNDIHSEILNKINELNK